MVHLHSRRAASWRLPFYALVLLLAVVVPARAQARSNAGRPPQRAAEERIRETSENLGEWLSSIDPEKELSKQSKQRVQASVEVLTSALDRVPSELIPVSESLLDLASYRITRFPQSAYFLGGSTKYFLRRLGLEALELVKESGQRRELNDWLTRGVLAERKLNSDSRRWLALHLALDRERAPGQHPRPNRTRPGRRAAQ